MTSVEYRDIPNSDNAVVTSDGRIFRNGKEVTYYPDAEGYLRCTVGKYNRNRVHIYVATEYCKGRKVGYVVDHINGNKSDNRAENLEWVSVKENARRAGELGLVKGGARRPIWAMNKADNKVAFFPSQVQAAITLFGDPSIGKDINKALKGKRMTVRGWCFGYEEEGEPV